MNTYVKRNGRLIGPSGKAIPRWARHSCRADGSAGQEGFPSTGLYHSNVRQMASS
jgi:hypothetical protein